jgi:hypothetical protein
MTHMRFLCTVEDVFEISGRGGVLTPGLSKTTGADIQIRAQDAIQLRRPDGSVVRTHIHAVEILDGPNKRWCVPVLLPPEFKKSDVPVGTQIWLENH